MKESKPPKAKIHFKLAIRRQTAVEEQQFNAAIDLLLAEWVRQEMDGQGEEEHVQLKDQRRTLRRAEAL